MNDFAKEELEDIYRALCEHDNPIDNYDKLINKIQSMIDNYNSYKYVPPDDMDSSALAWKYQHDE